MLTAISLCFHFKCVWSPTEIQGQETRPRKPSARGMHRKGRSHLSCRFCRSCFRFSAPPGARKALRHSAFEFSPLFTPFCLLVYRGNSQSTSCPCGAFQGCRLNRERLLPLWVSQEFLCSLQGAEGRKSQISQACPSFFFLATAVRWTVPSSAVVRHHPSDPQQDHSNGVPSLGSTDTKSRRCFLVGKLASGLPCRTLGGAALIC